MKKRSDHRSAASQDRLAQIIGLGEKSARKNYYPQLKERVTELERFKSTIELASNAFLIIDQENFKVLDANKAARDLFDLQDRTSPQSISFQEHIIEAIRDCRGEKLIFERQLTSPERGDIFLMFDFKWVLIQQKTYGILEGRDISERKRAEKELQEAKDNLEKRVQERTKNLQDEIEERRQVEQALRTSEKDLKRAIEQADTANKAKSQFLSNMSHELRTPLNGILGFGQLLEYQTNPPLTPKQQEFVAQILKGGNHLLELINDILDLSKIEAGKVSLNLENVNIGLLIDDCIDLITPLMDKYDVGFESKLNDTHRTKVVRADPIRLRQVLLNLLSNAAKYNKAHGEVFLSVFEEEEFISFEVRDTGKGISESGLDILFQPFNRLGEEGGLIEGTGIGLTISQNLVQLMDGHIEVTSKLGLGTCFTVYIPKVFSTPSPPNHPPDPFHREDPIVLEPSTHKILYIEDNAANVRVVEELVHHIPHVTLKTAPTGEVGLELANSEEFNLILVDINLPGMNGYEVCKSMHQPSSCPVFALSANAMQKDIDLGREAGFDDYLVKPLNIKETIYKISNALGILH